MKESKIVKAQGDGTCEKNGETFYRFEYEFENGDVGSASHKSESNKKNIGELVSYSMVKNKAGYNQIKFEYTPKSFSNGKSNAIPYDTMCLSYAKDLVCHEKIKLDDMLLWSEKMFDYIKDKRNGS